MTSRVEFVLRCPPSREADIKPPSSHPPSSLCSITAKPPPGLCTTVPSTGLQHGLTGTVRRIKTDNNIDLMAIKLIMDKKMKSERE